MSTILHGEALWTELRRRAQASKRLDAVVSYIGGTRRSSSSGPLDRVSSATCRP